MQAASWARRPRTARRGKARQPERLKRDSRIRVGIVSAHISDHSVWLAFVRGWVAALDPRRFEVHLFTLGEARRGNQLAIRFAARSMTARAAGELGAFHPSSRMDVLIYPEIGMDPATAKLASCASRRSSHELGPAADERPADMTTIFRRSARAQDAQAHYTETSRSCFPRNELLAARAPEAAREAAQAAPESPARRCGCSAPDAGSGTAAEHDYCSSRSAPRPGASSVLPQPAERCRSGSSGACGRRSSGG